MTTTVQYFGIPALGEPIRQLLVLGGEDWKDDRVTFQEWKDLKPKSKFGQLPLLTLPDGSVLSQTKAIFRYLAKNVKVADKALYSSDALVAFKIDELIDLCEDVRSKLVPTFAIQDQKEKEKARADMFTESGGVTAVLNNLEKNVGTKFALGECLTAADIWVAWFCNFLRCGFWDGIPTDYLSKYTNLSAICANVSANEKLKVYYTKMAESDDKYKCYA